MDPRIVRLFAAAAALRDKFEIVSYSDAEGFADGSGGIAAPRPAGAKAGDLLVALLGTKNGNVGTWTWPTGWTERRDQNARPNISIATKIYGDGNDPEEYSIVSTLNYTTFNIVILVIRKAEHHATGTIAAATGGGSAIVAPAIAAEAGILIGFFTNDSSRSQSLPAGMTTFLARSGVLVATQEVGSGSTGTRSSTIGGTAGGSLVGGGVLVNVKPAAS